MRSASADGDPGFDRCAHRPALSTKIRSRKRPSARDLELVIDERGHGIEESNGVRKLRVKVERSLVVPPRMHPKEPRIAGRPKGFEIDTSRFGPRWAAYRAKAGCDLFLPSFSHPASARLCSRGTDEFRLGTPNPYG